MSHGSSQSRKSPTASRPAWWGILSMSLSLAAASIHFWAGWEDEHRLVLQPSGHVAVFAAMAWFGALLVSLAVIALSESGRRLAFAGALICLLGEWLILAG